MWRDHNVDYTFHIGRLFITFFFRYYGRFSLGADVEMVDYSNTIWIGVDLLKFGLEVRFFLEDK